MGAEAGERPVAAADRLPADAAPTVLRGVGPKVAERLADAGIRTVADLLLWFPHRHAAIEPIEGPREDDLHRLVRVRGRVTSSRLNWLPGRRSMVTVGWSAPDGGAFEVRFFNQPYLAKTYATGQERWLEGRLERRGKVFQLSGAKVLPADFSPRGDCLLSYAEIPGVSPVRWARWVEEALARVDLAELDRVPLPSTLAEEQMDFAAAVAAMHAPAGLAEHEAARTRFAVAEAVDLFRRVEAARRLRTSARGPKVALGAEQQRAIEAALPFSLTGDQRRAIAALAEAMRRRMPMGALLQGDVGAGKTAVAVALAAGALAAGYQVAFLAPTELLAEQHAVGVARMLPDLADRVRLLTASVPAAERAALMQELREGHPLLVFGTHALFADRTRFRSLGLVVVDEQHRFGVTQRTRLVAKGQHPHVLYMTATPIPRSLAMTVFGDLEIVTLRERPPGHRPVRAFHLPDRERGWRRVQGLIDRRLRRKQQVFVVCPRVGAGGELGGAVGMHASLAARFPTGLIHGQMPAADRQAVLADFRAGAFGVLVGTTVLEVGVDVPSATLVVVVGVDRFGLATLHQLRGRVGRGNRRGVCVLLGQEGPRVEAVCATVDGFELAERDLALRGAGEFLGTRQSGVGDLRALDLVQDLELLQRVRGIVREEAAADETGEVTLL